MLMLIIDWNLFLYVSLIVSKKSSGAVLRLSGFPISPKLNEKFTLSCTINNANELMDIVDFYKNSTAEIRSSQGSLYQNYDKCFQYKDPAPGKTVICEEWTQVANSKLKRYLLQIEKLDVADIVDWWCSLKMSKQRSNVLSLKLNTSDNGLLAMWQKTGIGVGTVVLIMLIAFCLFMMCREDSKQ